MTEVTPPPDGTSSPASPGPATSRHELLSALLVGLIAIIVAMLVVVEVAISHQGARAEAAASRLASVAASRNNVSQAPFGFEISKTLESTRVALEGTARQIVALEGDDPVGQAIGAADQVAFERLLAVAREMGAPPDASSPLDGYARFGLTSRSIDIAMMVAEQNHQADFGGTAATRGLAAVLGLSLAALAGVLVGLAAVVGTGRPGSLLLLLGYVLAGGAFAAAVFAAGWLSGR